MEIDLLTEYPKIVRDLKARSGAKKDPDLVRRAKEYGWEYFDRREPRVCYGGYSYDGRWVPVVRTFIDHYKLEHGASILDIGCAKGYMLYDFLGADSSFDVVGIDISQYAVNCCPPEVIAYVGNAKDISMFKDKEFDLVICINTIHNLPEVECRQAVREIQRVGKNAFITVDAWSTDEEYEAMMAWNVTAETVFSTDGWAELYVEEGYTGDFHWFKP